MPTIGAVEDSASIYAAAVREMVRLDDIYVLDRAFTGSLTKAGASYEAIAPGIQKRMKELLSPLSVEFCSSLPASDEGPPAQNLRLGVIRSRGGTAATVSIDVLDSGGCTFLLAKGDRWHVRDARKCYSY